MVRVQLPGLNMEDIPQGWTEDFLVPRQQTESFEIGLSILKKGDSTKGHSHEWGRSTSPHGRGEGEGDELLLVLEGEGYITVDGETTRLQKGTLLVVPRGSLHQAFCDSPEGLVYLFATTIRKDRGE